MESTFEFTKKIRKQVLNSLNHRFNSFIESDLSLVSTFLDPRFGIASILDEGHKCLAKARVKALVIKHMNRPAQSTDSSEELETKPKNQKPRVIAQMEHNFLFDEEEPVIENTKDCIDFMIDEFTRLSTTQRKEVSCPLDFWKKYEKLYPEFAVLAKKFLSVQASSASCERMFSIAGHIFQCKRRRMSHSLFCKLVFLKLNESLY